jgi:hypothetical protein
MVNRQIIPSHRFVAPFTLTVLTRIPQDAPLLFGEEPLLVLLEKQVPQNAIHDLLTCASLIDLICILGNCEQVLAVNLLTSANVLGLLQLHSHVVDLRGKRSQKVPGEPVPFPVGQDEPLFLVLCDEDHEGVEVCYLRETGCVQLWENFPNAIQSRASPAKGSIDLAHVKITRRHDMIEGGFLIQHIALMDREGKFADKFDVLHSADLCRAEDTTTVNILFVDNSLAAWRIGR